MQTISQTLLQFLIRAFLSRSVIILMTKCVHIDTLLTLRHPWTFISFCALVILTPNYATAQTQEWLHVYGEGSLDQPAAITRDSSGHLYVAGVSYLPVSNYDLSVIKLSFEGKEEWGARYDGSSGLASGYDGATDIAVDDNGNIYVCGTSDATGTGVLSQDGILLKYASNGQLLWVRRFDGPHHLQDVFSRTRIAPDGSIVLTGFTQISEANDFDFLVCRYDTNGNLLWSQTHDGQGHNSDSAQALALDSLGNIYAGGNIRNGSDTYSSDMAIAKYSLTGAPLWLRLLDGKGHGPDSAWDLTVDSAGNVFATGISLGIDSDYDIPIVSFDSAGTLRWAVFWGGSANLRDYGRSISVLANGDVIVAGSVVDSTTNEDGVVLSVDNQGGLRWQSQYNGTDNSNERFFTLSVLPQQQGLVVTGSSFGQYSGLDVITAKYSLDGGLAWAQRFDGGGSGDDAGTAITTDSGGAAYVSGYLSTPTSFRTSFVAKYTDAEPVPPEIIQSPQPAVACEGATIELMVSASGSGPLVYQWMKDDVQLFDDGRVIGSRTMILRILGVTMQDVGEYRVIVSNAAGKATSNSAQVGLDPLPTILGSPGTVPFCPGGTATFHVMAVNGPLAYRWQRNGSDLVDSPRISGTSTDTLVIHSVGNADLGYYFCRVSNDCGTRYAGGSLELVSEWSPVGGGVDGPVRAMTVGSDSGEQKLFVAGAFKSAGGLPASNIASWDGSKWESLGVGLNGPVNALATFNDGTGPSIIAAGEFSSAGGAPATGVARWKDGSWSAVGNQSLDGPILAAASFDDGNGEKLYIGGEFISDGQQDLWFIAVWDGISWEAIQSAPGEDAVGLDGPVYSLVTANLGSESRLFVGGAFLSNWYEELAFAASWDGTSWSALGNGSLVPYYSGVQSLATVSSVDGGPATLVAGYYGGLSIYYSTFDYWAQLVSRSANCYSMTASKAFIPDPDEFEPAPLLLPTIVFGSDSAVGVNYVGQVDTYYGQVSALGTGVNGTVRALTSFDEGSGNTLFPTIFAGGEFSGAGGVACQHIARWAPVWSGVCITQQPQSAQVCSGNSATFSVAAVGEGPLTYQWLQNGIAIPGATGVTFTIVEAVPDDSGTYSVVVSGANGETTSEGIQLAVFDDLPSITAPPESISVCIGGNATFFVVAERHSEFQWLFNGEPILGAVASSHTVWFAQPSSAGQYSVVVTNPCGSVTSLAAQLEVASIPSAPAGVSTKPLTICPGGQSILTAGVSTGEVVDWYTGTCGGTLVGSGSPFLVSPATTTTYFARARNQATGCASLNCSQGVTVSVAQGPFVSEIPDAVIVAGSPYTGPTPVVSQGAPPVTWSLVTSPSGMTISSTTGVVSWSTPTATGSPHTITIRATNAGCSDDESWLLTVSSLPDLVVDSVVAPASADFGQQIVVDWTVRNAGGLQAPGNWEDRLYLSTNQTFDGSDVLLATVSVNGPLAPAGTYSRIVQVSLPINYQASGTRFVLVRTDAAGALQEQNENNNLGSSGAMTVSPTPAPDLWVESVNAPSTAVFGETITVSWTIQNSGNLTATGPWQDQIFLSNDQVLGGDTLLYTNPGNGPLNSGANYNRDVDVMLPNDVIGSGTRYILVKTDAFGVVTESNEGNNVGASLAISMTPTPAPDLLVDSVSGTPPSAVFGDSIPISWSVTNNGNASANGVWNDRVYLSTNATLQPGIDIPLSANPVGMSPLTPGGMYSRNLMVAIPPNYTDTGTYYLLVRTDDGSTVAESNENNNVVASSAISLTPTPGPDLVVESVSGYPASAAFGSAVPIQWTVRNLGNLDATGIWQDRVYLSTNVSFEPGVDQALSLILTGESPLAVGASYNRSGNVTLPVNFTTTGNYYLLVRTDDSTVIGEPNEANNALAGPVIQLTPTPSPDLVVSSVVPPTSANDGQSTTITWTVVNVGDGTANPSWADRVYLSTDSVLDPASDFQLGQFARTQSVPAGDSYTRTVPVTIPPGLNGPYYFAILCDATNALNEPVAGAEGNNARVADTPTQIVQLDPPDLDVIEFTDNGNRYTGQRLDLAWRVQNISSVGTANGAWVDRVYFSTDDQFDPAPSGSDVLLNQQVIATQLGPQATYLRTTNFTLPATPGNYWVFVVTDPDNQLYEANDSNNDQMLALTVIAPEYTATVEADITTGIVGTPVNFTGMATRIDSGEPVPNVPVDIRLRVQGTRRVLRAQTNGAGQFNYLFTPLLQEAGVYTVGADHPAIPVDTTQDTFTLYGMALSPTSRQLSLVVGTMVIGQAQIRNLGDTALSGISQSIESAPANLTIQVQGPTSLPALGTATINYSVVASDASSMQATPIIRFSSSEGATATFALPLSVREQFPRLEASPGTLASPMVRGERRYVQFSVTNVGGAPTGPLTIQLPTAPWLSLSVSPTIAPLQPGQQAPVVLELAPAIDLLLGPYNGTLVISGSLAGLSVPFTFSAVSNATGDLRIIATDEYTYYAEGFPKLANASVVVASSLNGSIVATGLTDSQGEVTFSGLTEAYYDITVSAPNHGNFRTTALVVGNQLTEVTAFLPRQTVSYTWTVTPTTTDDQYNITINTTFETDVPVPVITIEPAIVDLTPLQGQTTQLDLEIFNHGLIAASDVRIVVGDHPRWHLIPLASAIGNLAAQSSIVVPIMIVDGGSTTRGEEPCTSIDFSVRHTLTCDVPRDYLTELVCLQPPDTCPVGGGIPGLPPSPPPPPPGSGGNSGGNSGGSSTTINPPPPVSQPAACNPCAQRCALAIADCGVSFVPAAGCGWGIFRSCIFDGNYLRFVLVCGIDGVFMSCLLDLAPPIAAIVDMLQCACSTNRECNCQTPQPACSVEDVYDDIESIFFSRMSMSTSPLLQYLSQEYSRTITILGPFVRILGSAKWFNTDPSEVPLMRTWFTQFLSATDDLSENGVHISANERSQLLKLQLPEQLTTTDIEVFIDRINRTAEYWEAGIFDEADVPPGMSTDFIARDRLQQDEAAMRTAIDSEEAEGYSRLAEGLSQAYTLVLNDVQAQNQGVCAQVIVQVDQQAVVTRSAFRATLELENSGTGALDAVTVILEVRDESGAVATDLFGIYPPELVGIPDINGGGSVAPNTSARASWLILPTNDAAPTAPKQYFVRGSLAYTLGGEQITIPLFPVAITVLPNPSLHLKYFLERRVYGDDPFTPEIEPAIPFSLGLLVNNSGAGVASNLRITSAQPEITENDRGLLITFQIIGTQVGSQAISPSLQVNLGDIVSKQTKVARWLMTSSLEGQFTSYSATYEHVDPLGDPRLSLIDSLDIHEMNHVVRIDAPTDDGLPDFLTNDQPDIEQLPDAVYTSDGAVIPVAAVVGGTSDGPPTFADLEVQLSLAMPPGWTYVRTPNLGWPDFRLVQVRRPDGSQLRVPDNAWTTHRIARPAGQPEYSEDLLHLLDFNGPGIYTLVFAPASENDSDSDGIVDVIDNCPDAPNPDQADMDGDGIGDACDQCEDTSSGEPTNADGCACSQIDCEDGDPCTMDSCNQQNAECVHVFLNDDTDGDGIPDCLDNCTSAQNPAQEDADGDGIGDACDNCPLASNLDQADCDGDGLGGRCDNCPQIANVDQSDMDGDGIGDACEQPSGPPFLLGDVNGDAAFDDDDMAPFVETLLNPCVAGTPALLAADMNADGRVNGLDIQSFSVCLLQGCP